MRIAYFVHAFPSWSETFVWNQITGLQARGHQVEVFAQRAESGSPPLGEDGHAGLRPAVHYRPAMSNNRLVRTLKGVGLLGRALGRNPLVTLRALHVPLHGRLAASLELLYSTVPLLPRRSFDIVHCHFGPNGILATALRDTGVLEGPIVTTFHAYDLTKYLARRGAHLYDRLLARGDLFLVVSTRWRERLRELGCPEDKIRVHHMGVACQRLSTLPKRRPDFGTPRLLSVGRLVEKKGFPYGVRAVAELMRSGRRCEYTIVGDGPLRAELERLIRQLGVANAVRLAGRRGQTDVLGYLRTSDILLAPSVTASDGDQEGIPVVLMEAMATGLPVISTYHSGIPELVADGRSGYLVNERDVTGLTDRLAALLDNPQQRQAMGHIGRRIVERDFNIDTLNDRLVATFERLAAKQVARG
jgi:colanic acid/amylovoran biosynthesis glycosyltransferase